MGNTVLDHGVGTVRRDVRRTAALAGKRYVAVSSLDRRGAEPARGRPDPTDGTTKEHHRWTGAIAQPASTRTPSCSSRSATPVLPCSRSRRPRRCAGPVRSSTPA
ncbi:hypothetical protein [Ornithinimicrobium kibberense]|uniref:hypothetical protein n=1 Tax=Ornithinimicrobium kibberense TaxID=282060 RepID=UPI00360E9D6D